MRIPKDQLPVKIDVPGALARQVLDFGDATGFGKMAGEYFTLGCAEVYTLAPADGAVPPIV